MCGCGGRAPVATKTDASTNRIKGEHMRFISGHNARRPESYFLAKIDNRSDGCWPWRGARISATGYGFVGHGRDRVVAHRWVYERLIGPIPEGADLHHRCENKICVNPDHLEPLTRSEHMKRHRHAAGVAE